MKTTFPPGTVTASSAGRDHWVPKTFPVSVLWRGILIPNLLALPLHARDYYVSSEGADDNPGTQAQPVRTLQRARDAARSTTPGRDVAEAVTVLVRGGVYCLDETLVLGRDDSGTAAAPVVYRAFGNEKPVLIGGRQITEFSPHAGGILRADLRALGQWSAATRVLVFDGQRQELARYPNANPGSLGGGDGAYVDGSRYSVYADSPDEGGYLSQHQHLDFWQRNLPRLTRTRRVNPSDMRPRSRPEEAEVSIFPHFNWEHYLLIRHTCTESEDTGAIGGGAIDWLGWLDTAIRYNWIQDTLGYGYDESRDAWVSPYFSAALHPDWATSGVTIRGNVRLRAPRACLSLHSGRQNVMENNIAIDGGATQMHWRGWTKDTGFWSTMVDGWLQNYEVAVQHPAWHAVSALTDPRQVPLPDHRVMTGNVFRRNIVYYTDPRADLFTMETVPLEHNQSNYNLVYHAGFPLRAGTPSVRAVAGPSLLPNPSLEEGELGGAPRRWNVASRLRDGTQLRVVDDPARDDYRLQPQSPASTPEFEPIALEKIGPYDDELRASWPIEEAPGTRETMSRR